MSAVIIPANPGFYFVEAFKPDEPGGEWIFDKTPIIAWRILPISDKGNIQNEDDRIYGEPVLPTWRDVIGLNYILRPDGQIIDDDSTFESEEEWLQCKKRELMSVEGPISKSPGPLFPI